MSLNGKFVLRVNFGTWLISIQFLILDSFKLIYIISVLFFEMLELFLRNLEIFLDINYYLPQQKKPLCPLAPLRLLVISPS